MSGKLYIVPTPIGNLGDMSPRAVEILKQSELILCEDTRTSGVLLKHFGIDVPTMSHHKFNEHTSTLPIIERLKSGQTISLVSDAGTPGISDPGFMLSRECRKAEIEVETLPGPTAFVPALVNSGLPCDRFVFEGFLPLKKGRASRMSELASDMRTFIIYESPVRLVRTLEQLAEVCGDEREASVSREISKIHDTTISGSLRYLINYFSENMPRGEIVLVVSGCQRQERKVHRNKYKDVDEDRL
ncbi:MAG: 16S rRNA (cytidine(1402)-2'-O)-methyltransferase [Muribaculaceae bacterium]|nr:16S rRNA (cytidine(1402)-2'-O)-methyltransferase [Muribaculaceae bacterium]